MESILEMIIAPNYTIDEIDYDCLSKNPSPKVARLIMKHPNWYNISSNPNIGLTKFIIKNKDKLILSQLRLNTNPGLAELIISFGYDKVLCGNSNSGLTDFIKSQSDLNYNLLSLNINPGLYPIMKYWNLSNSNPMFPANILEKKLNLYDLAQLSKNTNPKLAELIIKHHYGLDWYEISRNSNSGLTQFIIDNLERLDLVNLAENRNPELTNFILKHAIAIDFSNTNKKLLKYKCPGGYLKKRLLSANPSAIYIKSKLQI